VAPKPSARVHKTTAVGGRRCPVCCPLPRPVRVRANESPALAGLSLSRRADSNRGPLHYEVHPAGCARGLNGMTTGISRCSPAADSPRFSGSTHQNSPRRLEGADEAWRAWSELENSEAGLRLRAGRTYRRAGSNPAYPHAAREVPRRRETFPRGWSSLRRSQRVNAFGRGDPGLGARRRADGESFGLSGGASSRQCARTWPDLRIAHAGYVDGGWRWTRCRSSRAVWCGSIEGSRCFRAVGGGLVPRLWSWALVGAASVFGLRRLG
jgi:hypothetical protein